MTLRFLGTGTSQGVPVIGCECRTCLSSDPRDTRLRTSLMVEKEGTVITIDCGPDFRAQMLASERTSLDGILITHEHQDHVAGLDDVRPLNFQSGKDMPLWADSHTAKAISDRFSYAFNSTYPGAPRLHLRIVEDGDRWSIGRIEVEAIKVYHGSLPILGYILDGEVAYLTDVKTLPSDTIERLKTCKTIIISSLRKKSHVSHLTLNEALVLLEEIGAQRSFLTHVSHDMGCYAEWTEVLPAHVIAAYDGLEIS